MKLLTLILYLASGDEARLTVPAWECHAISAKLERGWLEGGIATHDDTGEKIIEVRCVTPQWLDLITIPSEGNCEDEAA